MNEWIQDMKNYDMKSYNELKLENYFLKMQIKDYSEALEDWILVAQNKLIYIIQLIHSQ